MQNQITPFKKLEKDLAVHKNSFASVLPSHMTPEKFMRTLALAAQTNEDLLECNRTQLIVECQKAAKDGLLVDGREAAIVTYKDRNKGIKVPSYQPMIAGILKLIRNSGKVDRIDAISVYSNDPFKYNPSKDFLPDHNPDWFGDRGEFIGVYAYAVLSNGQSIVRIMNFDDIEKVRKVSKSGTDYNTGEAKGIWKQWYEEKAQVACLKRLAKRLPSSADVDQVLDHDNEDYQPEKDITPPKPRQEEPPMAPPVNPDQDEVMSAVEEKILGATQAVDAHYEEIPPDMPPPDYSQAGGVPI